MSFHTSIRGLRSFCIAAKCLSFKHAASQLYLTPSAVSHQIKLLEQELGFDLFVRKTRTIELTPMGLQFFRAIEPQLVGLEQTVTEFKAKPQNETIYIEMPEFFASELFIPRLSEWTRLHPEINIELNTAKSSEQITQAADLSIVLAGGKPNASIVHELFSIEYVAACSNKLYAQLVEKGYSALTDVPLILHKARPWSWHQWAELVGISDFDPLQIIQFDSMFGVVRAAQQGMGVALVPLPMSNTWLEEGLLKQLFDQPLVTKDRYYLVQHENIERQKSLAAFAKWIELQFINK